MKYFDLLFLSSIALTSLISIIFYATVNDTIYRSVSAVASSLSRKTNPNFPLHEFDPNKERHWSRLVVMYLPYSKNSGYLGESFSLIESWKTILQTYNHNDNDNIDLQSLYTESNHDALSRNIKPPEFQRKDENGQIQFPWLNAHRKRLETKFISDLPSLVPKNRIALMPAGPPLITDVLVVSSVDNDERISVHPDCSLLDNDSDDGVSNQVNLTQRVKEAQAMLELIPDRKNRTVAEQRTEARIGESRCFFLKAFLPSTEQDNIFKVHPAMHSVACLNAPRVQTLLLEYDIILRTDSDCFLLPHFNDPAAVPWYTIDVVPENATAQSQLNGNQSPDGLNDQDGGDEVATKMLRTTLKEFVKGQQEATNSNGQTKIPSRVPKMSLMVGHGGYGGPSQNEILKIYSSFFGLRHQGTHNIGSTWYGMPSDIVQVAALAVEVGRFLLTHDAIFKTDMPGAWPGWYRGVTTLYGGEVSVNHLIDSERLVKVSLDDLSTSNRTLTENAVIHVHCWHTPDFFSKFSSYPLSTILLPEASIDQPSWYAYLHLTAGRELAKHRSSTVETKKLLGNINEVLHPDLVPLEEDGLRCTDTHPHAYLNGTYCCASAKDCANKSINKDSACCLNNDYIPCPIDSGCIQLNPMTEMTAHAFEIRKYIRSRMNMFSANSNKKTFTV